MRLATQLRVLLPALVLTVVGPIQGQEHPGAEHPAPAGTPIITPRDLAAAITGYIQRKSKPTGNFEIQDPVNKQDLKLNLVRVHEDKLARVGPQTYFACTDLKNVDGMVYDLDFFMKGPDKDHLAVTEVSIHKKAGKPRYDWVEEGGLWKKRPLGSGAAVEQPTKKPEHPH